MFLLHLHLHLHLLPAVQYFLAMELGRGTDQEELLLTPEGQYL